MLESTALFVPLIFRYSLAQRGTSAHLSHTLTDRRDFFFSIFFKYFVLLRSFRIFFPTYILFFSYARLPTYSRSVVGSFFRISFCFFFVPCCHELAKRGAGGLRQIITQGTAADALRQYAQHWPPRCHRLLYCKFQTKHFSIFWIPFFISFFYYDIFFCRSELGQPFNLFKTRFFLICGLLKILYWAGLRSRWSGLNIFYWIAVIARKWSNVGRFCFLTFLLWVQFGNQQPWKPPCTKFHRNQAITCIPVRHIGSAILNFWILRLDSEWAILGTLEYQISFEPLHFLHFCPPFLIQNFFIRIQSKIPLNTKFQIHCLIIIAFNSEVPAMHDVLQGLWQLF